ncbi:ABC transporter substrate-binding protein [Streptosporangium sp. NPDC023615]|uniref:ABC transporter substrate-binding protein n=1 Tax=Streptosporangium sp. NPDC023615 TaxID=3154794 RepID=UPI00342023CF
MDTDLIRMAFDSMPETLAPSLLADHSGLQLAALTTLPLLASNRPGESPVQVGAVDHAVDDGFRYRFTVRRGLRRRDGSALTAADYRDALVRAAGSGTVVGYWLRNVRRVDVAGRDVLEIHLHTPDFGFPGLLALPGLAPGTDLHEGAGRYRLVRATPRVLALEPTGNLADEHPRRRIVVRRLKSPDLNVARFVSGEIDVTSDTAFPYARLPEFRGGEELQVRQIGVFVALCFEGDLAGDSGLRVRRAVHRALMEPPLEDLLPGPLLRTSGFLPASGFDAAYALAVNRRTAAPSSRPVRPGRSYRLLYDTYYPNKEIARAVACVLRDAGMNIRLVPDRYERRAESGELRLNLFRAMRGDLLGVYRGLAFLDLVRATNLFPAFDKTLYAFDARPHHLAEARRAADELDTMIADRAVCVPIAEVPGICLARSARLPWEWSACSLS